MHCSGGFGLRSVSMGFPPALLREAAPITVIVFPNKLDPLFDIVERLNYAARRGQQPQQSDVFILRPQHMNACSPLTGLTLENKAAENQPASDFLWEALTWHEQIDPRLLIEGNQIPWR